MPVVGSSAYNTAGQITSLVRSLLNDSQGNLFTDTVLLPYANSAYRKVQRALGNAGGGGFIQDDVLLVVTAVTQPDTSLQVSITDATAPPIKPFVPVMKMRMLIVVLCDSRKAQQCYIRMRPAI